MSYTRPAASAANFQFTGVAYTRPAASAADFAFAAQFIATGFSATTFGTPIGKIHLFEDASGFTSSHFGVPLAIYHQIEQATGFSSTHVSIASIPLVAGAIAPTINFGTPANVPNALGFSSTRFGAPRLFPYHAVGFASIQFGAAFGFQHWRAIALGPTARFGTPSTPTDRTQVASGFAHTRIGIPTAVRFAAPLTAQQGLASGMRATAFGHAAAATSSTNATAGANSTAFGTPASRSSERVTASALAPQTALGAPSARVSARAHGARATGFGTPSVNLGQPASAVHRPTRFGLATCVRSNTYLVRATGPSSRLGHPRAFRRFNYPASATAPTAAFGTPNAQQGHRVTGLAPGTELGVPLLQRNPLC